MHAGIIPITTNIFDPNDVLLLQASSNKDPESLLIALNIKESSWTASDTNSASALGSENLPLTNVANGEVTSIDDSILGVGLNSRNVNGYGTGGLGKCQGDCDRDSDCASGLKCWQRSGYTDIPGCTGGGSNDWDYCTDSKYFKGLSNVNVNGKGTGGL